MIMLPTYSGIFFLTFTIYRCLLFIPSLDDVNITETNKHRPAAGLDFLLMPELMNDKDSDEDDEENDADEIISEAKILEDENNKRKLQNLLHSVPPGIDLFRQNSDKENGFKYFTLESLSIETDLDYSRRPKLLGHGFTNERLDEMFSDR